MIQRVTRRTPTREARRQDLIHGTIGSIARIGYHNSTVQTICEEAGLSRGLIGHYFDGKEGLLLEAFTHLTTVLAERTRGALRDVGSDPLKQLLTIATVTFDGITITKEQAPVWIAFWGVAPWRPDMLALHRRLWGQYRRWIEKLITSAAAERGLAFDARIAALTYTQLVDGLFLGWVMEDGIQLEDCRITLGKWVCELLREEPARHLEAIGSLTQVNTEAGQIDVS